MRSRRWILEGVHASLLPLWSCTLSANGLRYILAVGCAGVVAIAIGPDPFEHGKYFPPRSPKIMLQNCFSAGDTAVWIPAWAALRLKCRKGGVDVLRPLICSCSPALGVHQNQVNFRKVFAQGGTSVATAPQGPETLSRPGRWPISCFLPESVGFYFCPCVSGSCFVSRL